MAQRRRNTSSKLFAIFGVDASTINDAGGRGNTLPLDVLTESTKAAIRNDPSTKLESQHALLAPVLKIRETCKNRDSTRCSYFACANCPNGLVGNDDIRPILDDFIYCFELVLDEPSNQ